jgi:hypothetical protein
LEYTWLNVISVLQHIDQTGCADAELYLVFTMYFDTHTGLSIIEICTLVLGRGNTLGVSLWLGLGGPVEKM